MDDLQVMISLHMLCIRQISLSVALLYFEFCIPLFMLCGNVVHMFHFSRYFVFILHGIVLILSLVCIPIQAPEPVTIMALLYFSEHHILGFGKR